MNRKWTPRRSPWKQQNETKILGKIEAGIRIEITWFIMILVIYNTACLAMGHNWMFSKIRNYENVLFFLTFGVFWKQSIVKPKFCLFRNQVWKMDFRLITSFQHCKGPFLPYGPYGFLEPCRIEWSLFSKVGFLE